MFDSNLTQQRLHCIGEEAVIMLEVVVGRMSSGVDGRQCVPYLLAPYQNAISSR